MRYVAHDQAKYPLATLVIVAYQRAPRASERLLELASQVAHDRGHTW